MAGVLTRCIGCTQEDDHPKHQLVLGNAGQVSVFWHMDCHSIAADCPLCDAQFAAGGGIKGQELADFIVSGGADAAVEAARQAPDFEDKMTAILGG